MVVARGALGPVVAVPAVLLFRALASVRRAGTGMARGARGALAGARGSPAWGWRGQACSRSLRAARPNLLILASDGLRPDHLSGNGYGRGPRPREHSDRPMARARAFSDTVVQIPRTAPSWTTLLTSQWAGEHPVVHTLVGHEGARVLSFITLASALAAQGYRTAVVSDYAGDHFSRFPFGFQRVSAPAFHFPDLVSPADARDACGAAAVDGAGAGPVPASADSSPN